jgi:hypothetical protein
MYIEDKYPNKAYTRYLWKRDKISALNICKSAASNYRGFGDEESKVRDKSAKMINDMLGKHEQ